MMKQLLILCPLKLELNYLLNAFSRDSIHFEQNSLSNVNVYKNNLQNLILAKGGHGKVQFGLQTQRLLHLIPSTTHVLCVGAAGGLAENLKTGDLVIGETTIEHDYLEKFNPNSNPPTFKAHSDLLEKVANFSPPKSFKVHVGTIASGDEDIVDAKRADELKEKTQALAVAWEGAGGARACKLHSIPFLEIRGITDNARDNVADAFTKNLNPCMQNIAQLIIHLSRELN